MPLDKLGQIEHSLINIGNHLQTVGKAQEVLFNMYIYGETFIACLTRIRDFHTRFSCPSCHGVGAYPDSNGTYGTFTCTSCHGSGIRSDLDELIGPTVAANRLAGK